jgi:hypothetical protein
MGLFDFIFRRSKTPVTQPAGVSGSSAYAGTLVSYEMSPDLQGTNLFKTLSNIMANVVVVGAGVRYYQNLLAGTSWSVTPKEDAGADGVRAAELVRTGLLEANMPDAWSTVIKRASLYRMMGFSTHEWVMRKRPTDGALIYASIEHRPQATIKYWDVPDVGGAPRGVVQQPLQTGDYYYIDRARLLYVVDNSLTDQPDGIGVLRHVVEHARRLARFEQLEGMTYETDLRGIPIAKIPYQQLSKFAKDNALPRAWVDEQIAAMRNFVKNHIKTPWQGITLDSAPYTSDGGTGNSISQVPQWSLELLQGDGHGLVEIGATIERVNREIARVMGMEFMMLGGDGKGSLALSRDKTSMFATVLESSLHELSLAARRDLVFPLLTLNGMDPEKVAPQLNPDPIATERIEVAVDALWKLAQAGAVLMPDDPAINQIRSRLHLADQPKLSPEVMAMRIDRPGATPGDKPGDGKPNPKDTNAEDDAVDQGDGSGGTKKGTFFRSSERIGHAERASSAPRLVVCPPELVAAIDFAMRYTKRAPDGSFSALDATGAEIGGPYGSIDLAIARAQQHQRLAAKIAAGEKE